MKRNHHSSKHTPKKTNVARLPPEPTEEMGRLSSLLHSVSLHLHEGDQHRLASDCAERAVPLFERRFPHDQRLREALRLRRLFAGGQLSSHEWLLAANTVLDAMKAIFPNGVPSFQGTQKPTPEQDSCEMAFAAAYATIAGAAEAAAAAYIALWGNTQNPAELRWQWNRLLFYFRRPTPDARPIAPGAAAPLPQTFTNPDDSLVGPVPHLGEQIEDLCWVLPEKDQQLFLADCAERTLYIFEAAFPHDKRPRNAMDARRMFVEKRLSQDEWRYMQREAYYVLEALYGQNGPPKTRSPHSAAVTAASIHLLEPAHANQAALFSALAKQDHTQEPNTFEQEQQWQLTRLLQYLRGDAAPLS